MAPDSTISALLEPCAILVLHRYISHEVRNDQNAIVGVLQHVTACEPPFSLPTTPAAERTPEEHTLWGLIDQIEQLAPNLPPLALREASLRLARLAPLAEEDDVQHLLLPGEAWRLNSLSAVVAYLCASTH